MTPSYKLKNNQLLFKEYKINGQNITISTTELLDSGCVFEKDNNIVCKNFNERTKFVESDIFPNRRDINLCKL